MCRSACPTTQSIDLESVEVKVDISGNAEDLEHLRIMLVSPEGTQSELTNFYVDPDLTTRLPPGQYGTDWAIDTNGTDAHWRPHLDVQHEPQLGRADQRRRDHESDHAASRRC